MSDTSPTDQQRTAVENYREMATGYANDDYFLRNRARLASAVSDRARGVQSADEVRNRLIIEAYAHAAARAEAAGEDLEWALDQAESELKEIVSLHSGAAGAGYGESGYLDRNKEQLDRLLQSASDGDGLSPSQLQEALQRIFIEENCHEQCNRDHPERNAAQARNIRVQGASRSGLDQQPTWVL